MSQGISGGCRLWYYLIFAYTFCTFKYIWSYISYFFSIFFTALRQKVIIYTHSHTRTHELDKPYKPYTIYHIRYKDLSSDCRNLNWLDIKSEAIQILVAIPSNHWASKAIQIRVVREPQRACLPNIGCCSYRPACILQTFIWADK